MRSLLVLTLAGFREAIRHRVTVVVAVFALALIALTTVVMNLTVFSLDRVVTDFGLGVMSLLLIGLAVFMSVAMLNREIERRTVFLVISRPIGRTTFLVGRYLGIVLTLTVLMLVMSVVYVMQLFIFSVPVTNSVPAALLGLWLQLVLLSAMGVFFSSISGQVTSAISVIGLYLVGQWTEDLRALSVRAGPVLGSMMRGLSWALPDFARADFKPWAAAGLGVEGSAVLGATMAMLAWATLFIVGGALGFAKKDLR